MFNSYEIVRIVSSPKSPDYVSKEGYIAGKIFENDDHDNGAVLGYGVYLFDIEEVVCFNANEITSLGRFIDPEEEMSGESVRVRNDGGRGVIVEDK